MVCVFRVYGYRSLTALTEVPGTGMAVSQNNEKCRVGIQMMYPYPSPGIFTKAYPYPGDCATGVHNLRENSGTGMNLSLIHI